jgi:diguanylate cyclase (GGDEF)-like protein/PAS domain S-box-containing protein
MSGPVPKAPNAPAAPGAADASLAAPPVREQASLLRLVANNVPALMAYYDAEGFRCLFANAGYARTFGFTEQSIVGRLLPEIIGEEAAREVDPFIKQVLYQHHPVRYERELAGPEGARWLDVQVLPNFRANGVIDGGFVLINDITQRRQTEHALRQSEERLSKFMDATVEGIVFHEDGVVVDANAALQRLVGYDLDELLGRRTFDFIPPEHREQAQRAVEQRSEASYESVVLHRDGTRIPVEIIARMAERGGQPMRMVILRDLRPALAQRERIHYLAHHDPLTGLLNRAAFVERLTEAMAERRPPGDAAPAGALLFIDLDHFKRVNDSLGHAAGDTLLRTLAARVVATLAPHDAAGRFGGDEFVVLLPGTRSLAQVEDVAGRLLACVGAPVVLEGRSISVTPSVGIALYPQHARSPDALVRQADAAMYEAKRQGRATLRCWDPAMNAQALAELELEEQLTQAIARDEFVLHYQPQVSARDGSIVGCEALIRWRHPRLGLVEPDRFVPLTEEQRLILPIGRWVLGEAIRAACRWRDAGRELPVSVNLSLVQLRDAAFIADIARLLDAHGLPGRLLEVEITERTPADDLVAARDTLGQLRALGVRIAIDDFGTGYSSLGRLNQLPIDRIKIDRAFVHGLPHDATHAAIVRAMVTLALGLGRDVVAEGVETEAQRDFLAALGCQNLQGLLFGAPREGAPFAA